MSKKTIYEKDLGYSLLKPYVGWCTKQSYSQCEVRGKENIPTDGAIIVAPNHCNTLMDALVILRAFKDESVFGARADMFNKPLIAKAMYFFRILPMVRQRDGLRNVLKNYETMDTIIEVLEHDVRFCMYPEGRHRPARSLLPLGKGVFRAAVAANAKFGDKKPIYIVPTGIEYGDYFRFRSTCLVTFGKPINVTKFVAEGNFESEPQAIEALRHELSARMSELITYIPDDENYESKWALTKMLAIYKTKLGYGQFGTCLKDSMLKNREIAAKIENAITSDPEATASVLERVNAFEQERKEKGISIYSFRKMNPICNAIGKGICALLGLPYFIFSSIASLPMWTLEKKIRGTVKDPAFRNTVSFGVKLGLTFILFVIYAALAFCLAPWWLAVLLLVLFMPSYSYFHDYTEGCRRWFSDIRLLMNRKLYKEFKHIVKDFLRITK